MSAPTVSVVIPAYNACRTLGPVLEAFTAESQPPDELIVVDNGSTDATAEIARAAGATVVSALPSGSVGRARNCGWDAAKGDAVVFLDADAVVSPGWTDGVRRAVVEHPGAIVGCARVLVGRNPWSWVAQLQVGTPWLPRGGVRELRALPSFCLAVPHDAPLRWDEQFGGEDGVFAADALGAGLRLVFDPRFEAVHLEFRDTFRDVRAWHRRLAYGMARCGPVQGEGWRKRLFWRFPVHYFLLLRLPIMYRRLRDDDELRGRFVRLLPRLALAEWALGLSAARYTLKKPQLRSPASGSASTALPAA